MHTLAASEQAFEVFAIIAVILLVASITGRVLKRTLAHGQPHAVIDNLNARITSWWIMTVVVAAAFSLGRLGVTVLFACVSFAALREFLRLVDASDTGNRVSPLALACVVATQYALVYSGATAAESLIIPGVLLALVARPSWREGWRCIVRLARLQAGLVVCAFCLSHVAALLAMQIPGYRDGGLMLALFLLVVVQSSDVLQYVFGKLLGRRRVAPSVSPSKTWAGLIGGIVSATALGALLAPITPFTAVEAALLSLIVTSCGFVSGLALSAIKRARGAKDWGRLIRGHGGVLDRVDSIVLAAPVFFYITRLGWT